MQLNYILYMYNLIKTVVVEIWLQLSILFCSLRPILVIGALQCCSTDLLPRFLCKYVGLKLNWRNIIKPCYPMFMYLRTSKWNYLLKTFRFRKVKKKFSQKWGVVDSHTYTNALLNPFLANVPLVFTSKMCEKTHLEEWYFK